MSDLSWSWLQQYCFLQITVYKSVFFFRAQQNTFQTFSLWGWPPHLNIVCFFSDKHGTQRLLFRVRVERTLQLPTPLFIVLSMTLFFAARPSELFLVCDWPTASIRRDAPQTPASAFSQWNIYTGNVYWSDVWLGKWVWTDHGFWAKSSWSQQDFYVKLVCLFEWSWEKYCPVRTLRCFTRSWVLTSVLQTSLQNNRLSRDCANHWKRKNVLLWKNKVKFTKCTTTSSAVTLTGIIYNSGVKFSVKFKKNKSYRNKPGSNPTKTFLLPQIL